MSDDTRAVVASLAGRTITRTHYEDPGDGCGEDVWVHLDDGRVVMFQGWGHDYWGTNVEEIEVVDIDVCLHCGQPHPDRRVFDNRAYCTNGMSTGWRRDRSSTP